VRYWKLYFLLSLGYQISSDFYFTALLHLQAISRFEKQPAVLHLALNGELSKSNCLPSIYFTSLVQFLKHMHILHIVQNWAYQTNEAELAKNKNTSAVGKPVY